MVGNVPGILPKTALVGSRVIYYPFTIPQQLNDSATKVGEAGNGLVKGINAAVGNAWNSLEPRGPAKWMSKIFDKVDAATTHSQEIATRNKTVFWDPFSQGVEQVGRAFASPGTYWYLKKAGVEQPTQDQIKSVLNMGLFKFPDGAEVGGGSSASSAPPVVTEAPAPTEAPAEPVEVPGSGPQGPADAASGAGEVRSAVAAAA